MTSFLRFKESINKEIHDKELEKKLILEDHEDQTNKIREEMQEMKKLIQKHEENNKEMIEKLRKKQEEHDRNQEYRSMADYAQKNILNPMDLSMSIVIKEGENLQNKAQQEMVVKTEKLEQLNTIFDRQKAVLDEGQESSDDEIKNESVFKLQEYLIETENPDEISKPLLL